MGKVLLIVNEPASDRTIAVDHVGTSPNVLPTQARVS